MKKLCFLLLAVFAMQSCIQDDEQCANCTTPPGSFYFELVDATTEENLFTNGTYTYEDVTIVNTLNNNAPVEFDLLAQNDWNYIEIHSIGWQTEIVDLAVQLDGETIFNLYVDVERKEENCCSYSEYNDIQVNNATYEQDTETGLFTIFVD